MATASTTSASSARAATAPCGRPFCASSRSSARCATTRRRQSPRTASCWRRRSTRCLPATPTGLWRRQSRARRRCRSRRSSSIRPTCRSRLAQTRTRFCCSACRRSAPCMRSLSADSRETAPTAQTPVLCCRALCWCARRRALTASAWRCLTWCSIRAYRACWRLTPAARCTRMRSRTARFRASQPAPATTFSECWRLQTTKTQTAPTSWLSASRSTCSPATRAAR